MKRYSLIIGTAFFCGTVFSQKTLSLEQCEELFQKNNLTMLAEQYNIDAARAAVIQAKIWEQPYVSGEINAVNPQDNILFDAGRQGQKALAIQQLIYLGGKKKKEVDFAKSNVTLAELQYEQLLRSLRFQLQQSFFDLYFSQQKAKSISRQLEHLDQLINSYSIQVDKGNIALKDVVRLQSLAYAFKNDLLDIQKNILNQKENLKVLTNTPDDFDAVAIEQNINAKLNTSLLFTELQLQEKAIEKNPEYLSSLKLLESNDLFLKWQKSLSVPDVTLGANYDQRGGAFNNQVNLTFGIPIPLWNKNKGAVKMAEAQLNQTRLLKEQKMAELKNKVTNAFNTFLFQQKQFTQSETGFSNFEIVYSGMLQNFQKRNVSLIEFADFMESYNQSMQFLNEMKKQLIISGVTLNFLTNDAVF